MGTVAFLNDMAEILQVDADQLVPQFELNENNFDSLALISTIAIVDEHFGITLNVDKLTACQNIQSLLDLVGQTASK
ncbi:MAG: acyl carrier protein [Candidatus Margulisbacteria bacterium]|nr:acyl carrier protein [Candidatus Margulisiibacteriota bacterium]